MEIIKNKSDYHPLVGKKVIVKAWQAEGIVRKYKNRLWASYFEVKITKGSPMCDKGDVEEFFEHQIIEL